MKQKTEFGFNEILARLTKLQTDVTYIKSHIRLEDQFVEEMKSWEEASEEDVLNWEKENL